MTAAFVAVPCCALVFLLSATFACRESPHNLSVCRCFAGQLAARIPEEGLQCAACRRAEPAFARAVAYGVYEDQLRELVHLLKYEGMRSLAEPLGELLAEAILQLDGELSGEVMVVAVPLFPANQRQRGYNQSVLLAEAAIRRLRRLRPDWRLRARHDALRRVKATESQFTLSARGRRRNLVGAFAVPDAAGVIGREVLVIDDIYTTGATARACASALGRAGARRVWIATLARAQQESVEMWDEDG
jgi:ComF family protein